MKSLPIDAQIPEIVSHVAAHPVTLLEAEPGAGKTTRVPPALLASGLQQVYVLEPRRLAARLAARRVAEELAERPGETVGYQVRFEEVSGPRTRLWYLTEGVLTRKLLSNSGLPKVRVVILDEFHERHLETDLAWALLRDLQRRRSELRLVIMSATLGGEQLAAKLGELPVLRAPGKVFPVSTRFMPESSAPLAERVAGALKSTLGETSGHVLIFLPGAAEIRQTIEACAPLARQAHSALLALHGDLSAEDQDLAVAPSASRKIICSTNVAESSITIDGVQAVIDSGTARVASFSPWSGMSQLKLEKISRSSAIQRSGRAGRTGPGLAIRLYSEDDFVRRPEHTVPEILRSDLCQTVLQLAAAGLAWAQLPWLDQPPENSRVQAQTILTRLGALSSAQTITALGHAMAKLPVHPRLACFAIAAAERGNAAEGSDLAAKLSEGRLRLDEREKGAFSSDLDAILQAPSSYAVRRLSRQIDEALRPVEAQSRDPQALELALLSAYPDRVARARGDRLLLSNGTTAKLDQSSAARSEFMIAIEADERGDRSPALVRIASAIQPDWLLDLFPERIEAVETMDWNRDAQRVEQVNSLRYDALTIDETRSSPVHQEAAATLLAQKAIEAGLEQFGEVEETNRLLERVAFAAEHDRRIVPPPNLIEAGVQQLAIGLKSFSELKDAMRNGGLPSLLASLLPMRLIDEVAPPFLVLPGGRRARIEYHKGRAPSVASRLQDFFGMKQTPRVANGVVPLVVHLLAPNQRPVQMTTDLVSFWTNLYPEVRRELSRRYPRHAWPERPT